MKLQNIEKGNKVNYKMNFSPVYSSALLRHLAYLERKANPALRAGQAIWNVAVKYWPKQVEPLRATAKDCFYNDKLIADFMEALNSADWSV